MKEIYSPVYGCSTIFDDERLNRVLTEQTLNLLSECVEKMRRWRIYDEVNYCLHKTILRLQEQADCAPSDDDKMYIYASAIKLVTKAIERIEYGERDEGEMRQPLS